MHRRPSHEALSHECQRNHHQTITATEVDEGDDVLSLSLGVACDMS